MKKEIEQLLDEYLKEEDFKEYGSYIKARNKLKFSIGLLLRKGEPFVYEYAPLRYRPYSDEYRLMDRYYFFGDILGFEIKEIKGNTLIGDKAKKEVSDEYMKKYSPEVGGLYLSPEFGPDTYDFPTQICAKYKKYDRIEDDNCYS